MRTFPISRAARPADRDVAVTRSRWVSRLTTAITTAITTAVTTSIATATFIAAVPTPGAAGALGAQASGPAMVVVVRHAEKADNSNDPPLSAAGTARAEALAAVLANANVTHVIVTQRQRTRLTAEPILRARGLTPEVVPFGRDMDEHVANIAAAVRRRGAGEVVLIVGHSNTVPMIVAALGGPRQPDLCDARYAGLFTVVPAADGRPASLVESSFGVPDGPDARACGGMTPR